MKQMFEGSITDVMGIRVGQAQNEQARTGVTVVLADDDGAVVAADVRGAAPGTRQTDLTRPENTVDKMHAVCLSGGSAFGLDAAGGVMRDVLVNDVPLIFRSELYATASMLGALAYCGAHALGVDLRICAIGGGLVVVAMRILAQRYKWALPKLTGRSQVHRLAAHRRRDSHRSGDAH